MMANRKGTPGERCDNGAHSFESWGNCRLYSISLGRNDTYMQQNLGRCVAQLNLTGLG
jgi:hypothetical protein